MILLLNRFLTSDKVRESIRVHDAADGHRGRRPLKVYFDVLELVGPCLVFEAFGREAAFVKEHDRNTLPIAIIQPLA